MADNEYNDEYQFADLDSMGSDHLGDEEPIAGGEDPGGKQPRQGKNILRNALIAVILIVLAMLGYKFFASYWANRKAADETIVPTITTTTQSTPPVETPPVQAVQPAAAPVETPPPQPKVDNSQVTQKLSDLEISQQNVRSEVNSVNSQLGGINSNVNDLSEKIASLNREISVLANKVDQQSNQIAILTERTKPKPPPVRTVVTKPITIPIYYIQAVIPGRAWLIAPNGSTLTVREGTQITGYGVIKLIDPNQGRILTSSGRVIRFSQQDS
ncbi:type IVB secretion system protein IcmG/DotF [Legionella nautarum]|uniref:type IVB secretion system protein IcmG/DotF n=1 Tax=Legionella nautarum TaxID=45070 RepID=UPI0010548368|nr:type IVB secretion system protein IcmG/DotF [Legionella nautarum]